MMMTYSSRRNELNDLTHAFTGVCSNSLRDSPYHSVGQINYQHFI